MSYKPRKIKRKISGKRGFMSASLVYHEIQATYLEGLRTGPPWWVRWNRSISLLCMTDEDGITWAKLTKITKRTLCDIIPAESLIYTSSSTQEAILMKPVKLFRWFQSSRWQVLSACTQRGRLDPAWNGTQLNWLCHEDSPEIIWPLGTEMGLQEYFWVICFQPGYLRLAPFWEFQGDYCCVHIVDKAPCAINRGVALYNSFTSFSLERRQC